MRKLTKKQQKTWDDLKGKAEVAYNEMITKITEYNGILDELTTFRDEIVSQIDNYISDRSERWQETDAASNYEDWKQSWENLDLDNVDEPDELDLDDAQMEVEG